MNKEVIKKILGKKGTKLVSSLKKSTRPKKLTIHKHGKSFTVFGKNNYGFWKLFQENAYEPHTFEIFNKFLDKNHSLIDMGAWIGDTALYGCQLSKHCYAIEPDPTAYAELKKNIELNPNLMSQLTLSNLCISDLNGTTKLYTKSNQLYVAGTSGSTITQKHNRLKYSFMVETSTFSKFISSFSIIDCNFIKMDVEGAEFKILPTMLEFIKNQKPTMLIEFHPNHVENCKEELNQLTTVFDCYDHIYNKNLKKIGIKDILDIDTSKTFHIVLSNKTV